MNIITFVLLFCGVILLTSICLFLYNHRQNIQITKTASKLFEKSFMSLIIRFLFGKIRIYGIATESKHLLALLIIYNKKSKIRGQLLKTALIKNVYFLENYIKNSYVNVYIAKWFSNFETLLEREGFSSICFEFSVIDPLYNKNSVIIKNALINILRQNGFEEHVIYSLDGAAFRILTKILLNEKSI